MQYLDFGNGNKFLVVRAIHGKNLLIHVSIFFVVCQKISAWNRDALSGLYRNSPYFNLDDFDSSIQTGDNSGDNSGDINDEDKRQNNDSKIV